MKTVTLVPGKSHVTVVTTQPAGVVLNDTFRLARLRVSKQTDSQGFETTMLYDEDIEIARVSDNPGQPGFGNIIFGGLTAADAFTSAQTFDVGTSGSSGSGGGSVSVNSLDIANGVDQSLDIDLIKGYLLDIKNEMIASKSIADLIVQDSAATPNYYVRKEIYNDTTNTSTVGLFNLDGSIASPPPVLPVRPVRNKDIEIISSKYTTKLAQPGALAGDLISVHRLIDTGTGLEVSSLFFNDSTGLVIASFPLTVTNIEIVDKGLQAVIEGSQTPAALEITNESRRLKVSNVSPAPVWMSAVSNIVVAANDFYFLPSVVPLSEGVVYSVSLTTTALGGVYEIFVDDIWEVLYKSGTRTLGVGTVFASTPQLSVRSDLATRCGFINTGSVPITISITYSFFSQGVDYSIIRRAEKTTKWDNAVVVALRPDETIDALTTPAKVSTTRVENLGSQAFLGANKRIRSAVITNLNSTPAFIQFFDSSAVLINGANPIAVYSLPPNGTLSFGVGDFGEAGTAFGVSPRIAFSSGMATLTLATVAYMSNIDYSFEVI